ncbi:TonB-dependent receptor domain-containing protein [Brevundimonas sp.]|uniref:TonB-dependent receptor domain-containing protein n=1 Tax=Brevundimonas sp. TaxID=1871086 RepID=UPI0028ADF187|nr:TonB-dependent receptor [Brevundimonas sp.]
MNIITKERLLSSTIVAGLAAGIVAVAPTAYAQSNNNAQEPKAGDQATQVEEVVVVGSRLRRDNYNSPSPIQVITRDEATLAGFASTTEALQGTAVTGGTEQINNAFGGYVTNGGPGANTLSLRGLGAERTLVLLNGRRVAPAGSRGSVGSADLNVLPSAMVERIEVLKDGASSVYGSDAVAGVVNIITRNNIDGVTVEGQYNANTDANGAGNQSRISIVAGTSGDRWHLSGSAEYYNRAELRLGDRDFTKCAIDGWTDGTDYIDPLTGRSKCYTADGGGVTINTIGTSSLTGDAFVNAVGGVTYRAGLVNAPGVPNGAIANGVYYNRWRPNAGVATGLVGFEGVGGGYLDNRANPTAFLALSTAIRDTFEDKMLNESLISPVEVSTVYLEGAYDLQALGNAEVYGEFLANRRESSQTGYRQLALDYYRGNLLIPSNLTFSNFSANQGLSPTTGPNANARVGVRAFIGYGNDTSEQTVDFAKSLAGIRGDFVIPGWRYDAYASYTRSRSEYKFEQFITNLLQNSLDVVVAPTGTPAALTRSGVLSTGATGTVTCRVNVTDPTAGCIPAPFLTSQTIGGVLPEDWKNYVFRPITGTTEYIEKVVSIGFDGPLFTLPAGQVQAFVGAEWRDAEIDDTPALDMQTGNIYNFSTATPTRGSESVWEVFGEIEAPLLANLPLVDSLTLNASARYTEYENAGSDTTYKVGLVYSPTSWLTVRGTYGTSYRAPALFEQFLGATSGFIGAANDPCSELTSTSNPNRIANCNSEGLGNFVATSSVRVFTLGGAANNLEPETSDNMTVGFVFQPQLPSGWGDLSFATDYYEIEINNSVVRLGGGAILSDCYNSDPSEFAARAGNCSFITRASSNNALTVESSYINIATDIAKGLDYTLRYRRDVGPGTATFNLGVTQVTEVSSQLLPTDIARDQKGRINVPEFSGYADLTYNWQEWRVRWGVEYIQATEDYSYYLREYGDDYEAAGYDLAVPDYFLHSASVQYRTDDWTATVGVRNIFNEEPPSITTGVYNRVGNAPLYSGYDYVGRSVFVNLKKSF